MLVNCLENNFKIKRLQNCFRLLRAFVYACVCMHMGMIRMYHESILLSPRLLVDADASIVDAPIMYKHILDSLYITLCVVFLVLLLL